MAYPYAVLPPYYGFGDAATTPLRSYFNLASAPRGPSSPSPRYASDGRYASNIDIRPPFVNQRGLNYEDDRPYNVYHAKPREFGSMPRRARTQRCFAPSPSQMNGRESRDRAPNKASAAKEPSRVLDATEADARACDIPVAFSLKNWDPREQPILLLGSVFDADSLGKWIYGWTVERHGSDTLTAALTFSEIPESEPPSPLKEVAIKAWEKKVAKETFQPRMPENVSLLRGGRKCFPSWMRSLIELRENLGVVNRAEEERWRC